MNGKTVTFLATLLSSTVGMILFVIIIAVSAIKGYGRFGDRREWENSPEDNFLVEQEKYDEQDEYPELYENEYDMDDYYKGEFNDRNIRQYE